MKKIYFVFTVTFLLLFLNSCDEGKKNELKFYGNVDVRTVSLAFQVSGKIDSIHFDEGQKIQKGDVLATLDSALYKAYLKQSESQAEAQKIAIQKLEKGYRKENIEKAKANLEQKKILMENAESTFERYQKLSKSKSVSEEQYNNIGTEYFSAKALYRLAKSNLELLQSGYQKEDILSAKAKLDGLLAQKMQHQIHLDETVLKAPANGILLTRVYEEGAIVRASQVVFEMAKTDNYWVRSYISEKYLGLIHPGMKAEVTADSGQKYEGVVSYISPLAEFTPKSVQTEDLRTDLVYRFRIILKKYDEMIKQGMPVSITFTNLKTDSQ